MKYNRISDNSNHQCDYNCNSLHPLALNLVKISIQPLLHLSSSLWTSFCKVHVDPRHQRCIIQQYVLGELFPVHNGRPAGKNHFCTCQPARWLIQSTRQLSSVIDQSATSQPASQLSVSQLHQPALATGTSQPASQLSASYQPVSYHQSAISQSAITSKLSVSYQSAISQLSTITAIPVS